MSDSDSVRAVQRAVLLVNTASRTGQQMYEQVRNRLEEGGLTLAESHAVDDPGTIPEVVRNVLEAGADLVVLGGGDGSISCAASVLEGSDAVLGVLPLGTANDFARTLGIPSDLEGACDTVLTGRVVKVDLGALGERRFVNVALFGLAVGVTRLMNDRVKRVLGPLAYPMTALLAFAQHRPFSVDLEFPDGDASDVTIDDVLQVAVGSGVFYGGGNAVAPDAAVDDRMLDVYVIPRGGMRRRWHLFRWFRSGRFVETENIFHTRTRRVRVTASPLEAVSIDGELVEPDDLESDVFSVRAEALRVLVPQETDAAAVTT